MRVTGVVKPLKKGGAVLRDPTDSSRSTRNDIFVPVKLIKRFNLTEGAVVTGTTRPGKPRPAVAKVESICGLDPEAFRNRTPFRELTAIDPHRRFDLSASGSISMRVMDIVAPIAMGTRGLIVSPPKAGKTMLLADIAKSVLMSNHNARVIALLVDERPEEVTAFRRETDAEVFASSNDESVDAHISLVEFVMEHVKLELECGRNVVVLVDSLTRMGRAFNVRSSNKGRVLSGGLDSTALEIPRRFFGMARAVENGGSVTIIATCLVDTGSRMDDYIFQEFKGTGNSELVLDRSIAEERVFPAVNINMSGTRKEELLYDDESIEAIRLIRRGLASRKPVDALTSLLDALKSHPTNDGLFAHVRQEYARRA